MSSARASWLHLLRLVVLRHWRSTPGQTAVVVLLLAVGLAVFLSVRLANRAAVAGFSHFTEILTGSSDWIVQPAAGTLPLATVKEIRLALGDRPVQMLPLIEAYAAAPRKPDQDWGGEAYTLLGVDLFAGANLVRPGEAGTLPWQDLDEGDGAWATPATLARYGQSLPLVIGEKVQEVKLVGPIPVVPDQPAPPERLLIVDLARLQEWLGRPQSIDRIEFFIEEGPRRAERREEIRQLLTDLGESRWTVTAPGAERDTAERMTQAFRLNLTILSLIALLVGLYLIGQTLEGTVVRRRGEIATLRALGVSQKWIQSLWLAEAGLLGIVGSLLGLVLGWLGAQVAVQLVGRTMNALYFTTSVSEAHLTWIEALGGLTLGTVACVLAAWGPARLAAHTPPAQLLAQHRSGGAELQVSHSGRWAALALFLGVGLCFVPGIPLTGGGRFPLAGHLAAFAWIAGGGVFARPTLAWVAARLRLRSESHAPTTIALAYLATPTRRHRIALAGLVCATAMTAGMVVLVASFEASVQGWIAQALKADLYLSSQSAQSASSQSRIRQDTVDRLTTWPGVTASHRHWLQRITWRGLPTQLHGAELNALVARDGMLWLKRPVPARTAEVAPAWASETFLIRFGVKVGDVLELPTPTVPRRVEIVASFSDYGNEQGALWLEFETLRSWWNEQGATSVALDLVKTADSTSVRQELLQAFPGLTVYENSTLRREILRIFRQTFSITYALEVIGIIVALVGLGLTLMSMGLERRADLTTLRALGFTTRELSAVSRREAALLAAVAGQIGIVLSLALGWLLVHIINRQSFGWTLQFVIPWGTLLGIVVLLTLTGALVGHWVGRWGAALPADQEEASL